MRNSSAKLKSVAYCVKLRMFELRMMSRHWMKINIVVVSLIVWTMGIRQQQQSQLRLETCQTRQKHLMKSFKCDLQRQPCEPHVIDEHRDPAFSTTELWGRECATPKNHHYSCAVRRMSYKMGSVSSFWCHIRACKFMLAYIYHALFRVGGG